MFIGFVPDNQKLYTELQKAGFILVYKPTISHATIYFRLPISYCDADSKIITGCTSCK
jgi:hypothetical protein